MPHPARLVAGVLTLLLAGCFGGDDDAHHGDGHHMGPSEDGNLPLDGSEDVVYAVEGGGPDEFRFMPDNLSAASSQRVGIRFTNTGMTDHEFTIESLQFHLHAKPGETVEGAFMAPADDVQFACYLPGHYENGMRGILAIEA